MVLTVSFPGETRERIGELIGRYIRQAAAEEWPAMARHTATMKATPPALAEALQLTLALTPQNPGQEAAQRHIATALENALDARRQRIVVSLSEVNFVKWACLAVQAICILVAIAMVHVDNPRASAIVMGIFGTAVAVSVLLIAAHNRPFTGEISVGPGPLLQLLSDGRASIK